MVRDKSNYKSLDNTKKQVSGLTLTNCWKKTTTFGHHGVGGGSIIDLNEYNLILISFMTNFFDIFYLEINNLTNMEVPYLHGILLLKSRRKYDQWWSCLVDFVSQHLPTRVAIKRNLPICFFVDSC